MLLSVGILLIFAAVLASVVCMLIRLRRSQGVARQQVRVVAMGASAIGLSLIMLLVGESVQGGEQSWWSSMPLFIAYVFMIGCITVAVLRYRLYDVEVIVSRALVVAMAAAFAVVGYVGLVVALGQSVEDRADGGFWLSLLVTAVVALAFQPLRRGVVRFADRLAYGTRAAPYDALADFSRRIGQSPAPGTVLPAIAAAAGEAVRAERVVVHLDVDCRTRPGRGLALVACRRTDDDRHGARPGRAGSRPERTARARSRCTCRRGATSARTSTGCWRTSPTRHRSPSATHRCRSSSPPRSSSSTGARVTWPPRATASSVPPTPNASASRRRSRDASCRR